MPALALVVGLLLFACGALALPHSPASPEAIEASQAMPLFFFGGAYVICAFFCRSHPKHGRVGIFLTSFIGVSMVLAALMRGAGQAPHTAQVAIFIMSFPVLVTSFVLWRRARHRLHIDDGKGTPS